MPEPQVTVVIPTLAADEALEACLRSLRNQTYTEFEVVVVDNSGERRIRRSRAVLDGAKVIENARNIGFGAAVNQGFHASPTPFLATLNDDAAAHSGWLEALIAALGNRPDIGMCASQIRLAGEDLLDSAGMLMCPDGSSKQRGHRQPPARFETLEEVLFPSACAAIYRRIMLEQIGGFDEDFFLYSEDTDLGLRARWAGWKCLYVPTAIVEHRYSWSAGRASPLKAYLVERNRLFVVAKNFPARALAAVPRFAAARYFWHLISIFRGRGAASQFHEEGHSPLRLFLFVLRAHWATLARWRRLRQKRSAVRRSARISTTEFLSLMRSHSTSPREVAAL